MAHNHITSSTTPPQTQEDQPPNFGATFHTSITDTLYASQFTPSSSAGYAGTLIFLVVLAVLYRFSLALGGRYESYVLRCALGREQILVARDEARDEARDLDEDMRVHASEVATGKSPRSESGSGSSSLQAGLKGGLIYEKHSIASSSSSGSSETVLNPWRISVDVPRGLLQFASSGIGYLLMLAVMTMNVGYFFAVLLGIFLGEVAFGRWSHAPPPALASTRTL